MSKKRKIEFMSPERTPRQEKEEENKIDWAKCFICQEIKKEQLQCSYNTKRQNTDDQIKAVYIEIAQRMLEFKEENVLPIEVNFHGLCIGGNLAESLYANQASHHKSCKLLFSSSKLSLAKKRINKVQSDDNEPETSRQSAGSRCTPRVILKEVCFFCSQPSSETYPLHKVHTFRLDQRVRQCVHILDYTLLHAKLQQGDLIAQDALYHRQCLTDLYRKSNTKQLEGHYTNPERQLHGIALSEIVTFIEESSSVIETDNIPIFKLSDLIKMYVDILKNLGLKVEGRIHSTRLKHRILAQFEDLKEYKEGREIFLAFQKDIGEAISTAASIDYDNEGYILAEAARIIRRDIFSQTPEPFNGNFKPSCQEDFVPASLKVLISMILRGLKANESKNPFFTQSMLTLSQLLMFNTTKKTREDSTSSFHSQTREPPIAVYIGEMIHSETRKLGIVDKLCHLGLSISSDRLLNVSTSMGNTAIEQFEKDKVVCPLKLKHNLFTVAAVDNIDVNPTSATAMSSFHGTAASLHQKVLINNAGGARDVQSTLSKEKVLKNLPSEYTDIPPAYLPSTITIPKSQETLIEVISPEGVDNDKEWLESVRMRNEDPPEDLSWAAYHAKKSENENVSADLSALLPMWRETSKSPAMIKHALMVIAKAVDFLNPGQVPVVAFDQPLYAIAKLLQWHYVNSCSKENFVIMLGPLHTEMAFMSAMGDLLEDSGWTTVIMNAGVTRSGVAQALVSGHDVARTKYAHQVTACCLNILIHESYNKYITDNSNEITDFSTWCQDMESKNAMFHFWSLVLKMELDLLLFVRAIRSKKFKLYILAIGKLLPWLFAFDHYHYARWLSVHLYDMKTLHQSNPQVYENFANNGNFAISRTPKAFSSMGIDQCHEQLNKIVKGDGGAIGLTEDEDKLRKWMVCGPEVARAVMEFEEHSALRGKEKSDYRHHEQTRAFQKRFRENVNKLTVEFQKLGNPFIDKDGENDLIQLDTRNVMGENVIKAVNEIETLGKEQAQIFMKERLITKTKAIDAPIKKNKLSLFSWANSTSSQVASKSEKTQLKKDRKLFAQLYISTQVRGGDVQELFSHETRKEPPSLSKNGEIRSGNKADLLPCLRSDADLATDEQTTKAVVLEGSVLVNMLKPSNAKTFKEYADKVFVPAIDTHVRKFERTDIVFDVYKKDSLKSTTRKKRGKGIRRKVETNSQPPQNWSAFLRIDENKSELFRFLSSAVVNAYTQEKEVLCAYDQLVVSSRNHDISHISPCSHEEADTRVFLHIKDMSRKGIKSVKLRTVDTDVVVIALALFSELSIDELWIEFGSGKNKIFYPIHLFCQNLGVEKSKALLFFHAFTGCDQVSYFNSCKKKTAWKTWSNFPEITEAFAKLSKSPSYQDVADAFSLIERFTALMYKKTTNALTVNEARREMFVKDGRDLETIPPTSAALFEHTLRAAYIGGYVWSKALEPCPLLPAPEDWGWISTDEGFAPLWTKLPEASLVIRELIKCKCNPEKGCSGRCTCLKSDLPCTELCKCNGDCEQGAL